MSHLDRRTADLRQLVDEVLCQFRKVDASAACGPHEELNAQELRLVEHLGDKGPRMMRELAEHLGLAVNSVTSVVDNLEKKKGLVRRRRSETDRRVVHVELTDAGRRACEAALAEKSQLLRGMLAALNDDEQEIFMVLFRKIARAGWAHVRKQSSA